MDGYKQHIFNDLKTSEIFKQLNTSKDGLSNKQARIRVAKNYQPPITIEDSNSFTLIVNQLKNGLVISLIILALIAYYAMGIAASIFFLLIAIKNIYIGYKNSSGGLKISILKDLSNIRVNVIRSGSTLNIAASELAIGDIVKLKSNDIIPSDLRLIETRSLLIDESELFNGKSLSQKIDYPISSVANTKYSNNTAFVGTKVISGTGIGVVISTIATSQTAKYINLAKQVDKRQSLFKKWRINYSNLTVQISIIIGLIIILIGLRANFQLKTSMLFVLAAATSLLPSGLITEFYLAVANILKNINKNNIKMDSNTYLENIGATSLILADRSQLMSDDYEVNEFMVGHGIYKFKVNQSNQKLSILDPKNKLLESDEVKELDLLFEAFGSLHNSPNNIMSGLTKNSGLQLAQFNINNKHQKSFFNDSIRQIESAIFSNQNENKVYAYGESDELLEKCSDVWERGHVRKLNKKDRQLFEQFLKSQKELAIETKALAYRILPNNTSLKNITKETAENDLILIGILITEHNLNESTKTALELAALGHLKVSILNEDRDEITERQLKKLGLNQDYISISNSDLQNMTDKEILGKILNNITIFSQISGDNKLRIVEIAKQAKMAIMVSGGALNDLPSMLSAYSAVFTGNNLNVLAYDVAEIKYSSKGLVDLIQIVEYGRLYYRNIKNLIFTTLNNSSTQFTIVLVSYLGFLFFHIPMAITGLQLLLINSVILVLPLAALISDKPLAGLLKLRPLNLSNHLVKPPTLRRLIGFGVIAGFIVYANYLLFYVREQLSPQYIDPANPIYLQATTLSLLTLLLCIFSFVLFERADRQERFFTPNLWSNKKLLLAFCISILISLFVIYNPLLQKLFKTESLSFGDWFSALLFTALYALYRLLQRHTRKHSRKAVLKLAREIDLQNKLTF